MYVDGLEKPFTFVEVFFTAFCFSMSHVSIIAVNYKQVDVTLAFLKSLVRFSGQYCSQVILVDNGATEDNGDVFRSVYPDVVYVRSEANLGFAGGNNLGVQHATGDYLLFLNNDTEITEGFVEVLVEEMVSHPEIGLLSPLILYHEDQTKIQYAGFTPMNFLTGRNNGIAVMEEDIGQYDQVTVETGYCHGAAMICRKADLERVGLMDEYFFLYYEELDWCEKFKRAGFKMGFTGKVKIYHKESISVGKESPLKTYFMVRNRWLFIRRNASVFPRLVFASYYMLLAIPFGVVKYLLRRRIDLAKAAFRGTWWNIRHRVDRTESRMALPKR